MAMDGAPEASFVLYQLTPVQNLAFQLLDRRPPANFEIR
jgi:hypothetical protein